MYSPQVLDHFQNPRNTGEVEAPATVVEVRNPACGDILRLSARMENGRVGEVRFRARGCVPAIACGSRLTEMIAGKTAAECGVLQRGDLVASLGGLPEASGHAAVLAMDALRELWKLAGKG